MTRVMSLGDLRHIIDQIGKGHDAKPIAILSGKILNLDATCVYVQGDRILFEGTKANATK